MLNKIWEESDGKIGSILSIDTETTLTDFIKTPEMVLGSAYGGGETIYILDPNVLDRFFTIHRGSSFIFHNAPFDIDVLKRACPSFNYHAYYDSNRIYDTSILYRLYHLAKEGWMPRRFNLKLLSKEFLDIDLDKEGDTRVTFEQYLNTDISKIPANYLEYAAMDAKVTYELYYKLRPLIAPFDQYGTVLSQHIQVKGDLALNRIYKRGIGFDIKRRDKWLKAALKRLEGIQNRLATWGWVRGMKGNKEKYENIVNYLDLGTLLPRTKDGDISSKSEDLEKYSGYPFINDYLRFSELEKLTSFVRDQDSERIHPRYNLLMNTGRTSCTKPNIQQLPRSGAIRGMYRARSGSSLIISDYSAIELSTLAQVLLKKYGKSVMAEKINEGIDLHRYYASVLHNIDEKDVTKEQRQKAKAANFGFPGGLGIETFIAFSAGYGLVLTDKEAQDMKNAWFKAFPEMRKYLSDVKEGLMYTITGRARGNTFYCASANTPFQGLASDGAKLAMYEMDKEGFNIVAFVHDEIICEEPDNDIEDATSLMERIMISAMKKVVPDVSVGVETQISRRYCK